ncbi:Squalene-hopene/tetraprenyl-beta-curcumene cyclase [Planctomycetales bacterium 10988]|nr:Squalene-hopene/tetraprenyl-beta-curcumene cyclase [Planctomycetales bacterium 10988]
MPTDAALQAAFLRVRSDLLAEKKSEGHWEGKLSASALSTATAISALSILGKATSSTEDHELIERGLTWLTKQQNPDGGFGDTDRNLSNIATSMLVKSALRLAEVEDRYPELLNTLDSYLAKQGGVEGIRKRYGKDKTFAVPILTNAALAGLVDWKEVSRLPFEMACLPQSWLGPLQLPVVSYALPALIAIGLVRHEKGQPLNPITRIIRNQAMQKALAKLVEIQPTSGGFLEATPLTSFVAMSLVGAGRAEHPVTERCADFLRDSIREDGSWPIDTNLATWVTTLSVNALAIHAPESAECNDETLWDWVRSCQHLAVHPYTGAAPGGWAWTDLSGGVPDADDTSGALLALAHESCLQDQATPEILAKNEQSALLGIQWLLNLQNRDGGWPTFCRGWGTLPFDRSSTDITAHAIRAMLVWQTHFQENLAQHVAILDRIELAITAGWKYLAKQQKEDGSWFPLWFGNQFHVEEANPIYGTSKVLLAYRDAGKLACETATQARDWLLSQQQIDGGWGNAPVSEQIATYKNETNFAPQSSIEETALALEALLAFEKTQTDERRAAIDRGLDWLLQQIESGCYRRCSPIGFYFAKLWYYEKLYPLVMTLSAVATACRERAISIPDDLLCSTASSN